jgi:hypothetical protein
VQRTRLNTLIDLTGSRFEFLFSNPWRRIALSLISLLMGFFMGSAITTTTGQDTVWDVLAAGILFTFTELTSRFVYSRRTLQKQSSLPLKRSLFVDIFNLFKVGLTYSLFLDAFKLGS